MNAGPTDSGAADRRAEAEHKAEMAHIAKLFGALAEGKRLQELVGGVWVATHRYPVRDGNPYNFRVERQPRRYYIMENGEWTQSEEEVDTLRRRGQEVIETLEVL